MKVSRPIPRGTEAHFGIDEMFFSTTDPKGRILDGNSVFIALSSYTKEELIGSPHNIIRHPDMPRIVFKYLWDYIESGRIIVAYVKNLAKDGKFYWVLAIVFPIQNEKGGIVKYLSIRIKPTTKILNTVSELYVDLKEAEEEGGMKASEALLIRWLAELGFKSYDDFMKKALFEEMKNRDAALLGLANERDVHLVLACDNLSSEAADEDIRIFCWLYHSFGHLDRKYETIFSKIEKFLSLNTLLKEKSRFIYELAEDIRILSLNASIEAYKTKGDKLSFSVLAQQMRINAQEGERIMGDMNRVIEETTAKIEDIVFGILCARLQAQMVVFFVKEILSGCVDSSGERKSLCAHEEKGARMEDLYGLLSGSSSKLSLFCKDSESYFRGIHLDLTNLGMLIKRLDFIHINGMIESAHGNARGFSIIFTQMLGLVESAKKEVENLRQSVEGVSKENDLISTMADGIVSSLQKLEIKQITRTGDM